MSLELKVKSKTLAEEARIIRHEERKLKKQIQWMKIRQLVTDPTRSAWANLNHHRRWDVRNEQRGTYLARAYIAGIPYKLVEQSRKSEYEDKFNVRIIPRIVSMVKKYGNQVEVAKLTKIVIGPNGLPTTNDAELKKAIVEWINKE